MVAIIHQAKVGNESVAAEDRRTDVVLPEVANESAALAPVPKRSTERIVARGCSPCKPNRETCNFGRNRDLPTKVCRPMRDENVNL